MKLFIPLAYSPYRLLFLQNNKNKTTKIKAPRQILNNSQWGTPGFPWALNMLSVTPNRTETLNVSSICFSD